MRLTTVLCFITCFVLAPTVTIKAVSPAAPGYTTAEILDLIKSMSQKLDMSEEKTGDLIRNFKSVSSEGKVKEEMTEHGVGAVFVYRSTEAGFLYKRRNGEGTIAFRATGKRVPLKMSGSSFGASIGGSAEWGVGLVMGLKEPRHFGGTYEGSEEGATAGDTTAPVAARFSNEAYVDASKAHDVFFIVSARGLSAGSSKGKITLTPEW